MTDWNKRDAYLVTGISAGVAVFLASSPFILLFTALGIALPAIAHPEEAQKMFRGAGRDLKDVFKIVAGDLKQKFHLDGSKPSPKNDPPSLRP